MDNDHIARIALRYDTAMSRAMLRALGIPVPERKPKRGQIVRVDKYAGIEDCRRQRHGVTL